MDFSEELSKFEIGSKERIFFEKVLGKLGTNFVCKSVEQRKREVHNNLNIAMQNYFELHIVATAIAKTIEQLDTSQEDPSSSSTFPYLFYLQKCLSSEVEEKPDLLGLSHENILKIMENKNSGLETASFKKLVEDNINDFCKKFIHCTGGTILPIEDLKKALERTVKELDDKVTLLSSEETKQRSKKILRNMIRTYYKELSVNVGLLNKLLSLHSKKLEFESDLAKFYLLRCHAVFLKIKVFEMKMLQATYNEETVPALKMISSQLDQTERKLNQEEKEKTVALEQYMKLGEEYENYVIEYTELIKHIEKQQWAIEELKKTNSQHGASSLD